MATPPLPLRAPRKLSADQIARAREMIAARARTRAAVAHDLCVNPATLRRALRA